MSTPSLMVTVEPALSGAVIYGPLAAGTTFGDEAAQLSLRLWIKNNETAAVVVNTIALSFVPPPVVDPIAIAVNIGIASGETKLWNFATADNVILPDPPPPVFTLAAWCNGFSDPTTLTLPLDPHVNPVAGSAYLFPARIDDLRDGEFWQGRSGVHSPAGGGVQLFGYDMAVVSYDGQSDSWTDLLPGGSDSKNEDHRLWGKPVYAMADGTVDSWANEEPTNPSPPADLSPPVPVEGNHLYIQHGPELVLYAHFQPGSLNGDLMVKGAPVKAGDFLGKAGNSGNSTGPHLHIHATKGTAPWQGPPQPITFREIHVVDRAALAPPSPEGAWVKVKGDVFRGHVADLADCGHPAAVAPRMSSDRAIDPLALILSGEVYVKLDAAGSWTGRGGEGAESAHCSARRRLRDRRRALCRARTMGRYLRLSRTSLRP